jgi:hypothetical protein
MSEQVSRAGSETPLPETHDGKLPYEKPVLRSEGVFETMALACQKIGSATPTCAALMKSS